MTRHGRRIARKFAAALSLVSVVAWNAAFALPTGQSSPGVLPTITTPTANSMVINQDGAARSVIRWASFNIDAGQTVQFIQPSAQAIAFNVVDPSSFTTIAGSLTGNGGVWVFSPAGVMVSNGASITTGSFLLSTGVFSSAAQTAALASSNNLQVDAGTAGLGVITIGSGAGGNPAITATDGYVLLQAPTITQTGAIKASDGVVLSATDGMTVSLDNSTGMIVDVTPSAPTGGSWSNVTSSGGVDAGWIELDAYNNNSAHAGAGVINLSGKLVASGFKPGTGDSIELLADVGSADPTDLVTQLNASNATISGPGAITATAGTLTTGVVQAGTVDNYYNLTLTAGPGGLTVTKGLPSAPGQAYGLSNLSAGPINVSAVGPLKVNGPITSSQGNATLSGDTITVGPGVTISAPFGVQLQAPDGIIADATSTLTSVSPDTSPGNGRVDVRAGSGAGPADIQLGAVNGDTVFIDAADTSLTRPAGGSSAGQGDLTLLGPINVGTSNTLFETLDLIAYRNVTIDAPINVQGFTQAEISTNYGAPTDEGDYLFGPNGSLNFVSGSDSGATLAINGYAYTLVYSEADLVKINDDLGGHYALANSIDLADSPDPNDPDTHQAFFFTSSPIADVGAADAPGAFYGTFTGLGHTISNLNITQDQPGANYTTPNVGLFGQVDFGGVVRDIGLVNAKVTAGDFMNAGTLVGYLNGTVENAWATGSVDGGIAVASYYGVGGLVGNANYYSQILNSHADVFVTGGQSSYAGGLVGVLANGATVQDSYATGDVTIDDSLSGFGPGSAGGLVGGTYGYPYSTAFPPLSVSISNSYATGDVQGGADTQVGGLIGDAVQASITKSYATGAVSQDASTGAYTDAAGGFAGFVGAGSNITQSWASGAVNSTGSAGNANAVGGFAGLVVDNASISDSYALGSVTSSNDSWVGGFAGQMTNQTATLGGPSIARVYATGALTTGTNTAGGLVGDLAVGSFNDSVWDSGTTGAASGVPTAALGTTHTGDAAVSGAGAFQQAGYAAFDFAGPTSMWVILPGETRPMLRSEYSTTISNAHQLQLMALDPTASYTLATDIDASETSYAAGVWNTALGFTPVGDFGTAFTGTFDGAGHWIFDLSETGTPLGAAQTWYGQSSFGALGVFGVEGATGVIRNVTIEDADITGGAGMTAGALVGVAEGTIDNVNIWGGDITVGGFNTTVQGTAGGLAGALGGTLGANAQISNSQSSASVNGGDSVVGGLVGQVAPSATVVDSSASGSVKAGDGGAGPAIAGGLVGLLGVGGAPSPVIVNAAIINSNASGFVTAGAASDVGGLVGVVNGGAATRSYATGDVVAGASGGDAVNVGGFVGNLEAGEISLSYATGSVETTQATTGSVGDAIGGFAGQVGGTGAVIDTSYSSGEVAANNADSFATPTQAGGFVGLLASGGSIADSYSLSNVILSTSNSDNTYSYAGGFAGVDNGSITDVYASGALIDPVHAAHVDGGLVGLLDASGVLSNAYWDSLVSPQTQAVGQTNPGGVATLNVGQVNGASAYDSTSYVGFDFTTNGVWYLIPGETRPILRAEYSTTITDAHQLQLMALDPTASYTVANDIDASETVLSNGVWNPENGFVPVGATAADPFTGSFDGGGHYISNLTIIKTAGTHEEPNGVPTEGAAGLFGFVNTDGVIGHVAVTDVDVEGGLGMSAGALVGNLLKGTVTDAFSSGQVSVDDNVGDPGLVSGAIAGGLVGSSWGTVSYSSSSADVSSPSSDSYNGEAELGGLVGEMRGGAIIDSHASGDVRLGTNFDNIGVVAAGGLVGAAFADSSDNHAKITGSYATGSVSAGPGAYLGGFIGLMNDADVDTSYATASVTLEGPDGSAPPTPGDAVGGFVGLIGGDSSITRSFASGDVEVDLPGEASNVGGFVGTIQSGVTITDSYAAGAVTANSSDNVGGFAGEAIGGNLTRVLASGAVSGGGNVGGLVGLIDEDAQIQNSRWEIDTTGQTNAAGVDNSGFVTDAQGLGIDGLDPYDKASYAGWDFEKTWSDPAAPDGDFLGALPLLYGVSHVVRLRTEDSSTVYGDYPVYIVDQYGFNPLDGPSLVHGLGAGPFDPPPVSGSGHYQTTLDAGDDSNHPYAIGASVDFVGVGDSFGYDLVFQDAGLTVTRRELDVSLGSPTKVYDGTDTIELGIDDLVPNGRLAGDDVDLADGTVTGTFTAGKNVGTGLSVHVDGPVDLTGDDLNNYTYDNSPDGLDSTDGSITKAAITITAVTQTKNYDGTTDSSGTPTVTSGTIFDGDSLDNLSQSFDSKNVGAVGNKVNISVNDDYVLDDGNGGGNYDVTLVGVQGEIDPIDLTITAQTETRTYNGTTNSSKTPLGVGLVSGDSITATQSFQSKDVGNEIPIDVNAGYTVNDGNGGKNYNVSTQSTDGAITPATLTISATSQTRTYDGTTNSSAAPTVSGLFTVAGDTVNGSLTQSYDSRNAGSRKLTVNNQGSISVDDGVDGADYVIVFQQANGTITKAPLTISAVTDTKVYDGTTTSDGTPIVVSGLVSGDSVSGLGQAFAGKNAGPELLDVTSYSISDGNNGGNYAVTLQTANGTIDKAPLTITAVTDTKVYDGTTTSSGTPVVSSGIVGGDSITGASQVFDSKNAGDRTLNVTGYTISDGNGGNNYAVTLVSADGTITPAPLNVSLTGEVFKFYDGTTDATLAPGNYVLSGVLGGDQVGIATVTHGAYDTPNQGFGKLVTALGVILTGADAGNYYIPEGEASGPIGVICGAACVPPPEYPQILFDPQKTDPGALVFNFPFSFFMVNLPPAPDDDDKDKKGDLFPVTGSGNPDLWTPPRAGAVGDGGHP